MKAGVIDPTKVTRTALQNAGSIAALMLTTEALVAEIPEPKSEAPMHARRRRYGRHVLNSCHRRPSPARKQAVTKQKNLLMNLLDIGFISKTECN